MIAVAAGEGIIRVGNFGNTFCSAVGWSMEVNHSRMK